MQTALLVGAVVAAVAFVVRQARVIRRLETERADLTTQTRVLGQRCQELVGENEKMTRNRDYWKGEALRLHEEAKRREHPFAGLSRLGK